MITKEQYHKIIDFIPSEELKAKIRETDYSVGELDLMRIVYHYADSFDARIEWLGVLSRECAENLRPVAEACIEYEQKVKERFERADESCVYELKIKVTPEGYEEKYLCKDLDTVKKTAAWFYEQYDFDKETEQTKYTVTKRYVHAFPHDSELEDYRGNALYGSGMVLQRLWSYGETVGCDRDVYECRECTDACAQRIMGERPAFPACIEDGEYAEFYMNGNKRRGIRLRLDGEDENALFEYYLVFLDADMDYSSVEAYNCHWHVPVAEAVRIPESELTDKEKSNAKTFKEFLKTE